MPLVTLVVTGKGDELISQERKRRLIGCEPRRLSQGIRSAKCIAASAFYYIVRMRPQKSFTRETMEKFDSCIDKLNNASIQEIYNTPGLDLHDVTTEQLVRIIKDTDAQTELLKPALSELYKRVQPVILKIALRSVSNHDDAEDIAQEVFTRIFVERRLSTYDCYRPLDGYLVSATKNAAASKLRRSKGEADVSLDELKTALQFAKPDDSESIDIRIILIDAIGRMQSEERKLVVFYTYFADLSDDEIAAKLHKSKAIVHILRHRALKQLRTIWEQMVEENSS